MSTKLKDKLKGLPMSTVNFLRAVKKVSSKKEGEVEANEYLILELEDSMTVIGTGKEYDSQGNAYPYTAEDAKFVKVNIDDIVDEEWKFTEDKDGNIELDKPGSYSGKLQLDVSRSLDVWLTPEPLTNFGKKKREEERQQRLSARFRGLGGNKD